MHHIFTKNIYPSINILNSRIIIITIIISSIIFIFIIILQYVGSTCIGIFLFTSCNKKKRNMKILKIKIFAFDDWWLIITIIMNNWIYIFMEIALSCKLFLSKYMHAEKEMHVSLNVTIFQISFFQAMIFSFLITIYYNMLCFYFF